MVDTPKRQWFSGWQARTAGRLAVGSSPAQLVDLGRCRPVQLVDSGGCGLVQPVDFSKRRPALSVDLGG
jgi:hypothetical protein